MEEKILQYFYSIFPENNVPFTSGRDPLRNITTEESLGR